MPRNTEQFDGIRKQRRKLIMDSALELFAEKGFHATSVSQIAKKAGISKGLSYNYFDSKNQLLTELIEAGFQTIFSNLNLEENKTISRDEFEFFIRTNFELMRKNLRYWKLFYSLMLQPSVVGTFQDEYAKIAELIFAMLFRFISEQGSNDPEGDMMVISAMLEGAYLLTITAPELFPAPTLENNVIKACFKIINGK